MTSHLPDPADREAMLDLIAAYAVHAVDDDERDFVERHLDDDPAYQFELGRHLEAAAALATEAPVPTSTWDAIRARTSGADVMAAPQAETPVPIPTRVANVIALDAARAARRSRLRVAVVAAAATAAIAIPATLQFAGGSSPSLAALAGRAAKERGARTISLKTDTGASLADVVVTADGRGYVRRDTLPELPPGQAYQLWAITGTTPVSAGVLGRDPEVVAFTVDAPTSAIAISVEPTAGSTQPSGTPIAVGTLT
jgi:anti-sigma-K factor RskA